MENIKEIQFKDLQDFIEATNTAKYALDRAMQMQIDSYDTDSEWADSVEKAYRLLLPTTHQAEAVAENLEDN